MPITDESSPIRNASQLNDDALGENPEPPKYLCGQCGRPLGHLFCLCDALGENPETK